MAKQCSSCSKAIWDPLWADYKCREKQRYVYEKIVDCSDYVEGKPQVTKAVDPVTVKEGEL